MISQLSVADTDLESILLSPPLRYACVQQGVYRSAYPVLRNFRFLSRLKLCTIVSLTPEPPSADLSAFADVAGVKLVHFAISRTSSLNTSLQAVLASVINLCINTANHPILIHCLDGRRIVGIVVLLLRRLQGWAPLPTMNEFWRYQVASRYPIPAYEIERTTRDLEKFTAEITETIIISEKIPGWLWCGNRKTSVPGVKLKFIPSLVDSATAGADAPTASNSSSSGNSAGNGAAPDRMELRKQGGSSDKLSLSDRSKTIDALSLHGLDSFLKKERFKDRGARGNGPSRPVP